MSYICDFKTEQQQKMTTVTMPPTTHHTHISIHLSLSDTTPCWGRRSLQTTNVNLHCLTCLHGLPPNLERALYLDLSHSHKSSFLSSNTTKPSKENIKGITNISSTSHLKWLTINSPTLLPMLHCSSLYTSPLLLMHLLHIILPRH